MAAEREEGVDFAHEGVAVVRPAQPEQLRRPAQGHMPRMPAVPARLREQRGKHELELQQGHRPKSRTGGRGSAAAGSTTGMRIRR